jgi:hypothetical protein
MTPRTPQCEVFWSSKSSSELSGVLEDSNPNFFQVLGFTPTLGQSRVATGCNARLAKEKRRARGTRVKSCAKKIQLQRDLENVEIKGLLSEAQGQLAEEFQDSVAQNRHISSANWLRYGDTCSKTFFDFHRIGKKRLS